MVKQIGKKTGQGNTKMVDLASRRSTPGATRTPDKRFRKPLLYPPELLGHNQNYFKAGTLP